MDRYVCVHGHFYQPPRENPWIEAIERQPSAGADHDWNCRVARECYIPNGAARVVNAKNQLVDLVNNYAQISFNFGPTLLSWYEKNFPAEYERLIEADRQSFRRLEGHGNAIAQAYNHMIMPLCSPRDKVTQVRWGIADFRARFGRVPEAMWLPETACNMDTLRVLAEHGMKYVILAPAQAQRVRPLSGGGWHDVSDGSIDPKAPYRCFLPADDKKGSHIDIFFYDGPLSSAIAFEHLMSHSAGAAERFAGAFDAKRKGPQLVSVATDGESYGHHEPFTDMGLAHLLKYDLPGRRVKTVNYGYYLAKHPPKHEVEIKAGPHGLGTAWSCAHGVGRWLEDCGCGAEGRHQKWRRPLREALDWLREELYGVFERESQGLLRDCWQARDAYVGVILDRSPESIGKFMAKHLSSSDGAQARVKVLRLMEMQRHAMMMYTSCGWFFSEISGIEAVQNLKYAARALQLAREASGAELEREFLARLKRAPSNLAEFGDGWGVYEKLVRPSIVTASQLAAQYAITALVDGSAHASGEASIEGSVELKCPVTGEVWRRAYKAVLRPDRSVAAIVDGKSYSLSDLFHDERARILNLILEKNIRKMEKSYGIALTEQLPLVEKFAELGVEAPSALRAEVELALGRWLADRLRRWDSGMAGEIIAFLERAEAAGLKIPVEAVEAQWRGIVASHLLILERAFAAKSLKEFRALVELGVRLGLSTWRSEAETRFFRLLQRRKFKIAAEFRPLCLELASLLNISLEAAA